MCVESKLGPRTAKDDLDHTYLPADLQPAPQLGLKVWSTVDGCPNPVVWDLFLCVD